MDVRDPLIPGQLNEVSLCVHFLGTFALGEHDKTNWTDFEINGPWEWIFLSLSISVLPFI